MHDDGRGRYWPAPECDDPLMLAVGASVRRLRQPRGSSRIHRIMTFPGQRTDFPTAAKHAVCHPGSRPGNLRRDLDCATPGGPLQRCSAWCNRATSPRSRVRGRAFVHGTRRYEPLNAPRRRGGPQPSGCCFAGAGAQVDDFAKCRRDWKFNGSMPLPNNPAVS